MKEMVKKCATDHQRFIRKEVTSYKIHTLMPKQNKNFILSKAADNRGQTKIGPRPWTEQPQGCGKPGFAIHMPSSFLTLEEKAPFYKDSWELRTKGKHSNLRISTSFFFYLIQQACLDLQISRVSF